MLTPGLFAGSSARSGKARACWLLASPHNLASESVVSLTLLLLLLDLHPALLLLLLLDFLLLILLLTPFVVSGFGLRGRSRPRAASRSNGRSVPAAPAGAAA